MRSRLRYTPFDVDLQEINETHLAELREVAEGWYSLEEENRRLNQIVAQQALDNWSLKELLATNC